MKLKTLLLQNYLLGLPLIWKKLLKSYPGSQKVTLFNLLKKPLLILKITILVWSNQKKMRRKKKRRMLKIGHLPILISSKSNNKIQSQKGGVKKKKRFKLKRGLVLDYKRDNLSLVWGGFWS